MAQNPPGYPPVPPGGYPSPPFGAAPRPYGAAGASAAERALEDWASARGYTLRSSPDVAWYQGWWPFQYAFRLARLGRELRAQFAEVGLFLVEAFEADELKRVSGEDRHLYAFVTSPKLTARAAIRAKSGAGALDDFSRGINSLFGGGANAGGVLGDPTFEQRFDVATPAPQRGGPCTAARPAAHAREHGVARHPRDAAGRDARHSVRSPELRRSDARRRHRRRRADPSPRGDALRGGGSGGLAIDTCVAEGRAGPPPRRARFDREARSAE